MKPDNPWIQAAGRLAKTWKDFAVSLIKKVKRLVGDPPTPAQLLAALQSAKTDLDTSVSTWSTKAAAKAVADAEFATAEVDLEMKRDTYDTANLAYVASLLPPNPE